LSTRRLTRRRASPEHLRQANHKSEVALKGSPTLKHRGGRVDGPGTDANEIRERDAELDGGIVTGARAGPSPMT
jgi:hypothetical protein